MKQRGSEELPPWLRPLALALAVASACWLAWWAAGGVIRQEPLQPKAGFKKAGSAWTAPVPRDLRGRIEAGSAVVWENGAPLWRATSRRAAEGGEPGTCFVRRDVIVFVPSDGSDPGTNGRSYLLRGPASLPWGWIGGIGAILGTLQLVSQRRGRPAATTAQAWTSGWGIAVFIATFALRAIWLRLHPDYNDGFMMAKGCPYSDAQAWLELAHSLVRGFGLEGPFASQRPLYPVLLAPWLAAGGPELLLAQLVNAAAGALTATLLGGLAARAAGCMVGICLAAVLAFAGFQSALLPLAMSETVAMSFAALALVFVFRGIREMRLWPLAVGGGMFGLANLVCTFTPLVWVLGGVVAAAAGFCSTRRWTVLLAHGGMVALGAALVLAPWAFRQRAVYGVTTLSLQAAEMLYAPVSASGRYSPQLLEEPAKAGVPDEPAARYRYFSEQWRKQVATDPGTYARTVGRNFGEFCATYPLEAMPLRALLVMAAAASAWRLAARGAGWCAWAAAAIVGACVASMGWWPPGWGLLVVGAGAIATRSRERHWLAMLMVALLAGVGAMDALTGNSITRRFWTAAEGAVVVLAVMAVAHAVGGLFWLLARAVRRPGLPPEESSLAPVAARWFENGAAVTVVLWAAVAAGWVVLRTMAGPREAPRSFAAEMRAVSWSVALRSRFADLSLSPHDLRLWAEPVEFTGRGCHLSSGENIHHWSRPFAVRGEPRTVAFARVMPDRLLRCLQMPGDGWSPDRQGRFLVVGVRNLDPQAPLGHETEMIEALAVFPLVGAQNPDLDGGMIFEPSGEARRIMGEGWLAP